MGMGSWKVSAKFRGIKCDIDVAMSSGLLLTRFASGASGTKVRFERLQIGEDGGKGEWFCTCFPMFEDADLNNDTWGTCKIGLGSSDGMYIYIYIVYIGLLECHDLLVMGMHPAFQ